MSNHDQIISRMPVSLNTKGHSSAPSPPSASAVFIGELNSETASGSQRLWAMRQCDVDVVSVDTSQFRQTARRLSGYWARLTRRFELLYDQEKLEQRILESCAKAKPDFIWFEWPRSFHPRFINQVKAAHPHAILIAFQDDNPFGTRHSDSWQWRHYLQCVPFFDLHLVKRPSDIDRLEMIGANECRLWMHGIYAPLFAPAIPTPMKLYPVSFVGTCFDDRSRFFEHLIDRCRLPVHVFGSHWQRRSPLPRRFPQLFHPEVTGRDYAKVIQESTISIALVSTSHHDEWSLRTFEIPGCAGTLLAQRTPMHETLFRSGIEAMFFSTPDECASAIQLLLAHPMRALAIGQAGYNRCVAENRFLEAQMRELLPTLKR